MNVDGVMCQKNLILVNLNNLRSNSINMVNLISTIEGVILSYFVNFILVNFINLSYFKLFKFILVNFSHSKSMSN